MCLNVSKYEMRKSKSNYLVLFLIIIFKILKTIKHDDYKNSKNDIITN